MEMILGSQKVKIMSAPKYKSHFFTNNKNAVHLDGANVQKLIDEVVKELEKDVSTHSESYDTSGLGKGGGESFGKLRNGHHYEPGCGGRGNCNHNQHRHRCEGNPVSVSAKKRD